MNGIRDMMARLTFWIWICHPAQPTVCAARKNIAATAAQNRNMIMAHEKDGVLENLTETYLENMGQYVAKSQFPAKLVLKEYHDRIKKKGK